MTQRSPVLLTSWVIGLVVAFVLVLRLQPGTDFTARAIDDLGQLLAAAAASAATTVRALHSPRGARRAWLLLAAATGAWALGEVVWSYYELLADRESPFPSVADAGFLLFPALAAASLLLWPSGPRGRARWRALLDGVLVAGALFILSWTTTLRPIVDGRDQSAFAFTVSLAYPVTDLALLTLTVVIVAHSRTAASAGVGLLAAGLTSLCVADSSFAYLTASGSYLTGSIADAGWFGGFLLIGAAALAGTEAPEPAVAGTALESPVRSLLPYLPAVIGLAVVVVGQLGDDRDRVPMIAAIPVVAILLGRQALTILDNRGLLRDLVRAQHDLRHQAFHDPLTGLANRALFNDRLQHGLDLHQRTRRPMSLLYIDLDGFKSINDNLGHSAGDAVLRDVATRLLSITRTGDTVARLGGDEFGVLIEGATDAVDAATRILTAFEQPATVSGHSIAIAASVGIAVLDDLSTPLDAETFLREADDAMYEAKRAGSRLSFRWTTRRASLAGDDAAPHAATPHT